MALQKVVSNVRHQMHRMLYLSARRCTNESDVNPPKYDLKNQHEDEQTMVESEYKPRGAEGINDVYLTGTIFGEVLPTTTGNGVTFLVDIMHNGRYGQYKVRTKVVAIGVAVPVQGADALREGQKVFVRGRLGSKVERSPDGTTVVRSTHVVGRFITFI